MDDVNETNLRSEAQQTQPSQQAQSTETHDVYHHHTQAAAKGTGDNSAALHSQTVGPRGPILEQDSKLHETLETFIHSKIIERPVHVKGNAAFGYFRTTHDMSAHTKLCFLQTPGQEVPVAVRFSLAGGNKGTPDTSRGIRGFATKFYSEQGVLDFIFNHIPVFTIRDPIRFPESIRALSPSPVNNLADPQLLWSFVARAPEMTHFLLWLFSDAGTVKSYRHLSGHSVNTYVWRNAEGVRKYVKYRWIPLAGLQYIDAVESARLGCENPDFAGQDLYDAIAAGGTVEYELCVQLMNPDDAAVLSYDPLDPTKVWDENFYPLQPVGRLYLNRNPDNYMEQVEKLAFSVSNLLDGAELSDDKILQGRANIYTDSQRRRIGPDFRNVPVNRQADWTPESQITSGEGRYVEGQLVRAELPKTDNFAQAGQFYRALDAMQQTHLVDNLSDALSLATAESQRVVLDYLCQASAALGERVESRIRQLAGS
ncbi:catalase [Paenibacillus sacheonensis]|uniref:catalase n=1 Tax=Paenibacillus sacheonensis TaxID=742054 RepID=A0A7X4YWS6_9BACL|nr:catalase [Paenibacillus sacheonensis]MBM7569187.1 catalase [Paenibacillus sacheonensis]NBC73011.1 catalase [Paenibacillus sacheonensis]